MRKKNVIGFAFGILILAAFCLSPVPNGLTAAGMRAIGLLFMGITLWITEAMPVSITALLLMILMPSLGIMEIDDIWKSFSSSIIFFIIAAFGVTGAMLKTKIPHRIVSKILDWAQNSSRKVVLGFVAGTAVLSSIISNTAACILFMGLALALLKANGDPKPGTSALGKCLMIGIPWAAMFGGIGTPIGNVMNIMGMTMLEEATGIRITFPEWMAVGYPILLLMVLFSSWWLCAFFKPEPISTQAIKRVKSTLHENKKWDLLDKKVVILLGAMFICWFASSWISVLDTTVIAVVGLVIMFLPGVNILTKDEFLEAASWDVVLMVGGVTALVAGILNTGAIDYIVTATLGSVAAWPVVLVVFAVSLLATLLHVVIPSGPAVLALTLIPMLAVADITGISPVVFCMIIVFWSGCEFILPIDFIPLLTFGKGYYSFTDMAKVGIVNDLFMVVLTAVLVLPLVALVGL